MAQRRAGWRGRLLRFLLPGCMLGLCLLQNATGHSASSAGRPFHVLNGAGSPTTCIAFSPNASRLALGRADGSVAVFDVAGGRAVRTLRQSSILLGSICFSPDGRLLLASGTQRRSLSACIGEVQLWDIGTGRLRWSSSKGPDYDECPAVFSPKGDMVASGNGWRTAGGKVTLWDASTGVVRHVLSGHPVAVTSVSFSADGRRLASWASGVQEGRACQEVRVWDATRGVLVRTIAPRFEGGVGWLSSDGKTVSTVGAGIHLWDVEGGAQRRVLGGDGSSIMSLAASGASVVTGDIDGLIQFWDVSSGKVTGRLRMPDRSVRRLLVSPDRRALISLGEREGTDTYDVWVWNVAARKHRPLMESSDCGIVALSPDGHILALVADDGVRLWKVQSIMPGQ